MKHRLLLLASLSSLFVNTPVFAAAFQLYEIGTPIIGTAAVGQAAEANDASTAYYNPAGMTALPSSEYMIGTQLILPYANFSPNSNTTISGNNGGNAGGLLPGVSFYYVHDFSSKLKAGISLTTPYGGALSYNNGWVGRYVVQNMQFYTLNLNPAIAYQFNNWFAAGIGMSVEYANFTEKVAIPLPIVIDDVLHIDGQANVNASNTAAGVNAGLLFTPSLASKIGVAYRSRITHDFRGNTSFMNVAATPSTTTKMVMPQNIIVSAMQDLTKQFVLLAELGWSNWSTMNNTVVNIAGLTGTTPRDWSDTYRVGLGGQFKATPAFTIQAGGSYDSSPTNATHRLPDLPMDRQLRLGAGIMYSLVKAVQLGFSYEYINMGKASIDNTSINGVLAGDYSRNFMNVVQASINVAC